MKEKIILLLLCVLVIFEGLYCFQLRRTIKTQKQLIEIEKYENGQYTNINNDAEISKLKKENRELYEIIEGYKDEVTFLTEYNYSKKYTTDTVFVSKPSNDQTNLLVHTYKYSNEETDSLNYLLMIGSYVEPNWYKLDLKVNDKFTIINRNAEGVNQTTIKSENGGIIDDVTVFNKKKTSFWKNFTYGPAIGIGYGMINNKIDIYVGGSITYSIK